MASRQTPLVRPTARVLLLDAAGRTLLFRAVEVDAASGSAFWFAPGGGLEPGESYEDAARRELFEETGLDVAIGPCIWTRAHTWHFAHQDTWIRSVERYYVTRTAVTEIVRDAWTALERATIAEHRWWSAEAMLASPDLFVPRRLPELLPAIAAGAWPSEPFDVGV